MSSKAVGDRLRTAMKAAKVTGEGLSQMIELSLSGIRKWTSGQTDPSFSHMARSADVLDMSLDWLATGEGPMRRSEMRAPTQGHGWDAALMRECIKSVDELLVELDRELDADAKADLIFEVYGEELERKQKGQRLSASEVVRILKRAS